MVLHMGRKKIIWLLVVLAVILIVGCMVFFFTKGNDGLESIGPGDFPEPTVWMC